MDQQQVPRTPAGTGRWVEPAIGDATTWYAAHPETRVDEARWAELEPYIRSRAAQIEWRHDDRADVAAAIRLRIIEAATGSRHAGEDGEAVRDYLDQRPSYIVQHASGRVYSALRRDRRHPVGHLHQAPREEGDEEVMRDPVDPTPGDLLDGMHADELAEAIAGRLTPMQARVFRSLRDGWTRPEIAHRMGLNRRTIHDHVAAIRQATVATLRERRDEDLLADIADRSIYRRSVAAAA